MINFCIGSGLRRFEVENLKVKDVYKDENDHVCVHVERGKGGREREVSVVKKYEKHIWNCRQKALDRSKGDHNAKIFEHIPNGADIHSCRRDYAQEKYAELLAKRDPAKRYDDDIVKELAQNMGHNRVDVLAQNYLD